MTVKRNWLLLLKKLSFLTSVSVKLTKLTGKAEVATHPKFLINQTRPWYLKKIRKSSKVLDFGCGKGEHSMKIFSQGSTVIGFDNSKNFIKLANSRARGNEKIKFLVHDGNKKLPFKTSTFDVVLMLDVLEHLNKRLEAIRDVRRVLKPGGLLLLTCDNPDTSWKRKQRDAGLFYYADRDHKYEYPKEEIIGTLNKIKFKVVSVTTTTYDTPFKPVIDLIGGISLSAYSFLNKRRLDLVKKHSEETTGFNIIAFNSK